MAWLSRCTRVPNKVYWGNTATTLPPSGWKEIEMLQAASSRVLVPDSGAIWGLCRGPAAHVQLHGTAWCLNREPDLWQTVPVKNWRDKELKPWRENFYTMRAHHVVNANATSIFTCTKSKYMPNSWIKQDIFSIIYDSNANTSYLQL